MPAYWDGAAQIIELDENEDYKTVKYYRYGTKIQISTLSISDMVISNPEVQVDYSELAESNQIQMAENHKKLRDWSRNCDFNLWNKYFSEWAYEKSLEITQDVDDVHDIISMFFKENSDLLLTPPKDFVCSNESKSMVQRHYEYWNSILEITLNDGFLGLDIKNG